jgi:NADH:ubiquinone reductase (H+-translocating)
MHRIYHVSRMPTWNRRIRIVFDWTGALFLGREVVSLGQINDPKAEFDRVAVSPRPATGGHAPSPQTDVEQRAVAAPRGA